MFWPGDGQLVGAFWSACGDVPCIVHWLSFGLNSVDEFQ